MLERIEALRDEALDWCVGRSALVRAPLLLWMIYLGVRHLADSDYTSLLGALNLGIHEAGHLLFSWLGWDFLTVAGGTLLQVAAPIGAAVMFARQPDFFAAAFSGSWLATNLYNIATYAADARELDLPLVTVGDGECLGNCHDWNYMLSALQLLSADHAIAFLFRLAAFGLAWGSVAAGAWMLWRMARSEGR
jgi:hypothetical protein